MLNVGQFSMQIMRLSGSVLDANQQPVYKGGGEGAYNASVAAENPARFALLDAKMIGHGGGQGKIEVCDLLSIDRELIHVKMYGKSAVFSHLFAQGFVSGQLIQIDSDFRKKVRGQLTGLFSDLIQVEKKPAQDEFTIVYSVISDIEGDNLHLPFFSRVNLNNTSKILKGFGYKVELLKIAVDNAGGVRPLSLHHARIQRIDTDLFWP